MTQKQEEISAKEMQEDCEAIVAVLKKLKSTRDNLKLSDLQMRTRIKHSLLPALQQLQTAKKIEYSNADDFKYAGYHLTQGCVPQLGEGTVPRRIVDLIKSGKNTRRTILSEMKDKKESTVRGRISELLKFDIIKVVAHTPDDTTYGLPERK